jgi:hypothetical protein
MFTVKNENELLELLRVVSEEAVAHSRKKLNESEDPYVNHYQNRRGEEVKNLFEEEADEDELQTSSEDDVEEIEDIESGEPVGDDLPEEEGDSESEQPHSGFGSSLDTLFKDINSMRAGRSLKDKEISQQLQVYYDRLADDERNVLSLFLRELSKILSGNIEGTQAADPSDPPPAGLNVDIVAKGEESAPEEETADQEAELATPAEEDAPEEEEMTGEEDTSPPIKVNESQDYTLVRKRIREFFER